MKRLIVTIALMFDMTQSFAQDVSCELRVNTELVSDTRISLEPNVKKMFKKQDNFRFYMTGFGGSKYEIEVYNPIESSRVYSTGYLRTMDDRLAWGIWAEEYLFEISCRLFAEK